MTATEVEIEGRALSLTNLDRVLWPAAGFTKGRMIDYYRRIAPVLLPHVAGRPVTMWRFPEGVEGPNWFQNSCRGAPGWMRVAPLPDRAGGEQRYCVVDDEASLVWVANQDAVDLHPFLWRLSQPERPTEVVFDLDPGPDAGMAEAGRVAVLIRELLRAEGSDGWVKTTGSVGLHLHVPLARVSTFGETKAFARAMATGLARAHPDLVVDRMDPSLRRGRVFVDWAQNDPRRSTIAPWSLRATPVPAAATPIAWEAVEAEAA